MIFVCSIRDFVNFNWNKYAHRIVSSWVESNQVNLSMHVMNEEKQKKSYYCFFVVIALVNIHEISKVEKSHWAATQLQHLPNSTGWKKSTLLGIHIATTESFTRNECLKEKRSAFVCFFSLHALVPHLYICCALWITVCIIDEGNEKDRIKIGLFERQCTQSLTQYALYVE